jgi:hypothetical protein
VIFFGWIFFSLFSIEYLLRFVPGFYWAVLREDFLSAAGGTSKVARSHLERMNAPPPQTQVPSLQAVISSASGQSLASEVLYRPSLPAGEAAGQRATLAALALGAQPGAPGGRHPAGPGVARRNSQILEKEGSSRRCVTKSR